MLIAGVLRFSATGRVLITTSLPGLNFNGGTPISETGALAASAADPESFLAGLGYDENRLCAREGVIDGDQGGLARTGVGSLALALTEPITGYIAGLPVTADGRLAVEFETPPETSAFTDGFDQQAFA